MSEHRTIIEPFRIKAVEQLRFTTRAEREGLLRKAHYNPFLLHADDVLIDLLTDSGTSAMSAKQWAGVMDGDESYAGSRSYFHFEDVAGRIFGFTHIIPVHQGRAAERILFTNLLSDFGEDGRLSPAGAGKLIPSNNHFDTTRANIEFNGAEAVDLVIEEGRHPETLHPFKGNMDVAALEALLREHASAGRVPVVMLTITDNTNGGQPVSMANIRAVSQACRRHDVPFFLDACRFAENAYFIKLREEGYADRSVLSIAQEMFSYADGCTMSAKKDAFANIGGFLAMNDEQLYERCKMLLIITEGFESYGGLAGRDLEAIAQGLEEVLDEHYLAYRLRSTAYLGEKLTSAGVPILQPPGGHAIYIDARRFFAHVPVDHYPGQAVVAAMYVEGGIRAVEIGSVMFGTYDAQGALVPAAMDLVRLAIPRRVYTQSHIDYVGEVLAEIATKRTTYPGFRIVTEPRFLRHFTATFAPA